MAAPLPSEFGMRLEQKVLQVQVWQKERKAEAMKEFFGQWLLGQKGNFVSSVQIYNLESIAYAGKQVYFCYYAFLLLMMAELFHSQNDMLSTGSARTTAGNSWLADWLW